MLREIDFLLKFARWLYFVAFMETSYRGCHC